MNLHELKLALANKNIHPDAVSIGIGIPSETEKYCILKEGEVWEVYYSERGHKRNIAQFQNENEACWHLLHLLEQDKSVWLASR